MQIHIQQFDFDTANDTDWEDLLSSCRHSIEDFMNLELWHELRPSCTDHIRLAFSEEHPTRSYGDPENTKRKLEELFERLQEEELPEWIDTILRRIWDFYMEMEECHRYPKDVGLQDLLLELEAAIHEYQGQKGWEDNYMDPELLQALKEFLDAMRNRQHTVLTLGRYRHSDHQITLYLDNIRYTIRNNRAYRTNEEKIAKVVAVYAHELFHAYHAMQIDLRNEEDFAAEHNKGDAGSSLITTTRVRESLAEWFEYSWCRHVSDVLGRSETLPVLQELDAEFRNESFPQWPYAGAEALVNDETSVLPEKVFRASLTNWHIPYAWIRKAYQNM